MPEIKDISAFIPPESNSYVTKLLKDVSVRIEIKSLQSSLGKFQCGPKGSPLYIRMKQGMSKPLFLLVLLHEIAHLYVFLQYGKGAKPHGREWKQFFGGYLKDIIPLKAFPEKVEQGLKAFIRNPSASMINSKGFYRYFDEFSGFEILCDLNDKECFVINGRKYYQRTCLSGKHIKCRDLQSGKTILARASAAVKKVEESEVPESLRKHLSR